MDYDIIIIGAGSGGLNIAGFMNKAGFKVLLVDKNEESIGGDCLNYGCVPSKALIHAARTINASREASKFSKNISLKANMKKVRDYIKEKQDIIRQHENKEYFKLIGMDVEIGEARFRSNSSISINDKEYSAKKIIIATGSRPRKLLIPGSSKVKILTNENIFDIKKLPKKFLVIGGGPIGIEIGQAFSMLGSDVTIVHNKEQILPKEDPEIAEMLTQKLKEQGIELFLNAQPKRFTSKKQVIIDVEGKEQKLKFDEVFASVGRELSTEGLDLEKAEIEVEGNRIVCDEYLRTTNRNVLLSGDIVGSYKFTHAAEIHASLIINNFFRPFFKKKIDYSNLSWVTYTKPEIATFGMNEENLSNEGIEHQRLEVNLSGDDRAIIDDATDGKLILFISKGRILGGSMIADNAGELSQELILAMTSGLDIKEIFNKIYPYPVASRINKKIISSHFSSKLTKNAKKILRFLYRI